MFFMVVFGSVGSEEQTNDGLVCLREKALTDVRMVCGKTRSGS